MIQVHAIYTVMFMQSVIFGDLVCLNDSSTLKHAVLVNVISKDYIGLRVPVTE